MLINYGTNAIKYGRQGGHARFALSVRGGRIRVAMTDDGIGIPASNQDKIFQAFQRAGQEVGPIEGTGVGLAITKRLAELMHGEVGFTSVERQGSEFWIELPSHDAGPNLDREVEAPALTRARSLNDVTDARFLVVCVEDNRENIAFMRDLLDDYACIDVIIASTAEVGIEVARSLRPHIVLMDLHLPGMSGTEAARRLSAMPETRAIPVIAVSAAATLENTPEVREAHFREFLTKPLDVAKLTRVLEELLLCSPRAS